jgi:uncharacterized protein
MATLKERLRTDLSAAIKARDELRTATLRLILAAIANEEVAGSAARTLTDDEVVTLLRREAKRRVEAAEAFDAAGRVEAAGRERAEGAVVAEYLPAEMRDEELAALVAAAIAEAGVSGPQAMGAVMKLATPRVAGRAAGARLAAEVRRQLDT